VKVATTKAQRKLFFNLRKTKQRLGWFNQDEVEMVARELGVSSKDVREMESRMAAQDMTFDMSSDDDASDSQPMAPVLYLQDKMMGFLLACEIECAVLGNDFPQASTCGEVVLNSDFYSYDTKYIDDKGAQVVVPAALDASVNDRIRAIAIEAYQALGCRGMARVDVFLTADNEVIINEINTLPGFTNISMYPKLWQASAIGSCLRRARCLSNPQCRTACAGCFLITP
jgi:hypothetical protein